MRSPLVETTARTGTATRPAATAAIATHGVTKDFPSTRAVDEVDLHVPRGALVGVLGPSGCGKTTLLRLLAGFERPDAGTVEVDGRTAAGEGVWMPPDRRRVGMVFQDFALFPHLDVADNIAFGLPRGRGRRQRVQEIIELVGLAGREHSRPSELSGGQQQRVALARALAPRPAVVLLDEPFSNLDAGMRAQVRADVERILRADGATAVLVTHDQEEALAMSDEVAVMREGRIVQQAPPEDLYHQPADRRVAEFVGDADFVCGYAERGQVRCDLGCLELRHPVDGEVEVMIRPEDLELWPDPEGESVVEGREFYGHDQLVHVRLASGRRVHVRLGSVSHVEAGDRVGVRAVRPLQPFPEACRLGLCPELSADSTAVRPRESGERTAAGPPEGPAGAGEG